jgi:NAD(P)-dependent dehydrogenase (short-subunit alcohol dehydrogenase family)
MARIVASAEGATDAPADTVYRDLVDMSERADSYLSIRGGPPDVDLYGVLCGTLAAYPIMARQGFGHIVNTASAGAFFPDPGNAPYCTAKHALIGLSLSLRLEGMDLGVRVSAACPGYVRTNIFENASVVNMPARAAMHGRLVGRAAPRRRLPRRRPAMTSCSA